MLRMPGRIRVESKAISTMLDSGDPRTKLDPEYERDPPAGDEQRECMFTTSWRQINGQGANFLIQPLTRDENLIVVMVR